jgi:hypothetical protein
VTSAICRGRRRAPGAPASKPETPRRFAIPRPSEMGSCPNNCTSDHPAAGADAVHRSLKARSEPISFVHDEASPHNGGWWRGARPGGRPLEQSEAVAADFERARPSTARIVTCDAFSVLTCNVENGSGLEIGGPRRRPLGERRSLSEMLFCS